MPEVSVFDLWLPIILACLATHVWSTLAWTVLPYHMPEIKGLGEKEGELIDWVESSRIDPGKYLFPYTQDMKEAGSVEFKAKQARCRGQIMLWEQPVSMPAAILKTLTFFLVAAITIGFVASLSLPRGAGMGEVFLLLFMLGLLTHCYAKYPHLFWFPEKNLFSLMDGVIYALITAAIFAFLWPASPAAPAAADRAQVVQRGSV